MIIEMIKKNTHAVSLIKLDDGYEVTFKNGIYWDTTKHTTLLDALEMFNLLAENFNGNKSKETRSEDQ